MLDLNKNPKEKLIHDLESAFFNHAEKPYLPYGTIHRNVSK